MAGEEEPGAADMEALIHQFARSRDPRLREWLILHHQRLVHAIAARFLYRGETLEDLVQAGNVGLINALDRFDPEQGVRFSTYATQTIGGTIRRHFRDGAARVKVPRWLQELRQKAQRVSGELHTELRRPPTLSEVAERLRITEEDLITAMESVDASRVVSLDTYLVANDTSWATLHDLVGRSDGDLERVPTVADLRAALARLDPRQREILVLRFFHDLSQTKIARRLGISQMHVSRLQQRALATLRECLRASS